MFTFLKKKDKNVHVVVKGIVKPLHEVEDQVFSQGLVGRGVAIIPEDETVYAPVDGTLSVVFPTGHAFGILGVDGMEYLIHIGIDTVQLKGEGFVLKVKQGQSIKQGDPLVKVDFQRLKDQGFITDTILLVTTPKETYSLDILKEKGSNVDKNDEIMHCEKS